MIRRVISPGKPAAAPQATVFVCLSLGADAWDRQLTRAASKYRTGSIQSRYRPGIFYPGFNPNTPSLLVICV